jgi:hypothetical protein
VTRLTEPVLPTGLKRATFAALVLSGMMGFGAAEGVAAVLNPPAPSELDFSAVPPMPGLERQPELYREAVKSMMLAQVAAWQGMKGSRLAILAGLWATSALVFVSALRMVRPLGSPRFAVRGILATTALISTVLRVLDGAQEAAVARRAGAAFDKVLSKSTELPGGWPDGLMSAMYTGKSVFLSLLIGGGLLMLSRYYRSEKIQNLTRELDAASPPPP